MSEDTGPFDVVANVVTSTDDAGPGTLREAILNANRNAGYSDTITFAIGSGPVTISPASALPVLTDAVTLDATTQPGYVNTPIVRLDGAAAGAGSSGLLAQAAGVTIRGFAITRFGAAGVSLDHASGAVIADSYIGTDGANALGNGADGITIAYGSSNEVRGTVISGNPIGIRLSSTSGNQIRGNRIGTNAAGVEAIPNSTGILGSGGPSSGYTHDNVIGGSSPADRNVISGNADGISLIFGASQNRIEGNYVGTNAAGDAAIANTGAHGIGIYYDDNIVRGNLISGNTSVGLRLDIGHRTLVENNLVGTDAAGTVRVPNGTGISYISSGQAYHVLRSNVVSGNAQSGMYLFNADHFTIVGNKIGTTASGADALPNGSTGIEVSGCVSSTIGGTGPGDGNVVSGNLGAGIVLMTANAAVPYGLVDCSLVGNRIGTDSTGTTSVANVGSGIRVSAVNMRTAPMGGIAVSGNLLSGNTGEGLRIEESVRSLTASGNKIGTDVSGMGPLPNGAGGVALVNDVHDNLIGPGNVISGNFGHGVQLLSASSAVPVVANVVSGNLIGTDGSGGSPLGNQLDGVRLDGQWTSANQVTGNVISGNGAAGVDVTAHAHDNVIVGNRIGTNSDGSGAAPNGQAGVNLDEYANSNWIGRTGKTRSSGMAGPGVLITGVTYSNRLFGKQDRRRRLGQLPPGPTRSPE